MSDSDRSRTTVLAQALRERIARAEDLLWKEMNRHGLRREDGWTIVHFTREASGGTELVMRPLHLSLPTPGGMECAIAVGDSGGMAEPRFSPGA